MFCEPNVDVLLERIGPEQFMEWQYEFALRGDELKRAEHEATVSRNMAARTRG